MILTFQSLFFVGIIIILFSSVHPKYRMYFLALASVGYVCLIDVNAALATFIVTIFSYLSGILIGYLRRKDHNRIALFGCGFSIVCCIAALVLFKYSSHLGLPCGLFIPIGFSFYIFQSISYLIDVNRGLVEPEINPARMLIYLMWFPKFISGPIERKEYFDRQLANLTSLRIRDGSRWVRIVHYVITGFFYKIVIADRLSIYVDSIFAHCNEYDAAWLFIGMIMYTLQIYFDFAGYSYAAIGFSLIFGIELSENFRMPYLSTNITDFWRRWHISLSSWLKDYLYIPLGGNRHGNLRKVINTLIVFVVCGAWHGESISFVVWGLLHGIYSAIDSILAQKGLSRIRSGICGRITTFLAVSFAWIFFRAANLSEALSYIKGMFIPERWFVTFIEDKRSMYLYLSEILVILLTLGIAFCMEIIAYRKNCSVPEVLIRQRYPLRYVSVFALVMMILIIGIYGPGAEGSLIYMQF